MNSMAVAQPIGLGAEAAVGLEEGTSAATENKSEQLETGSSSPSSSPKSTKQEVAQSNGKPQKQVTCVFWLHCFPSHSPGQHRPMALILT